MKILLLDGAPFRHLQAAAARRAVTELSARRGWSLASYFLPDTRIADCAGDFKCWTHTPGRCAIADANQGIAAAVAASNILVMLTPVTFGGYAAELKKAVDHLIQDVLPFFVRLEGETHHEQRYISLPRLVGIGLAGRPAPEAERIFRTLVARNARNMASERHAARVFDASMTAEEIQAGVTAMLHDVGRYAAAEPGEDDSADQPDDLPAEGENALPAAAAHAGGADDIRMADLAPDPGVSPEPPRSVLLLSGSPRRARSSSASLGGYLVDRLAGNGLANETVHIHAALRSDTAIAAALEAAERADLVILSCPLYVDSLPAPVIRMLERIAAHRRDGGRRGSQRLLAIVNSGFPEVEHSFTALAICRQFAREAGFAWLGGLPLGGGHGLVQSRPLESIGRRARHVREALDLTAAAVAAGRTVPVDAVRLFARPFVPAWLYRLVGNLGWQLDARRHGMRGRLKEQPYSEAGERRTANNPDRSPRT